MLRVVRAVSVIPPLRLFVAVAETKLITSTPAVEYDEPAFTPFNVNVSVSAVPATAAVA